MHSSKPIQRPHGTAVLAATKRHATACGCCTPVQEQAPAPVPLTCTTRHTMQSPAGKHAPKDDAGCCQPGGQGAPSTATKQHQGHMPPHAPTKQHNQVQQRLGSGPPKQIPTTPVHSGKLSANCTSTAWQVTQVMATPRMSITTCTGSTGHRQGHTDRGAGQSQAEACSKPRQS